jgi:DNA-binding protein H-NS
MMKKQITPMPTDTDVMEKKIDDVSTVSTRLEEELEAEREMREKLEQRVAELQESHNKLATQFIQLASKVSHMSKGNERTKKSGVVPASSLVGTSVSHESQDSVRALAPPPSQSNHSEPSSGVARGRRRGGL